MRVFQGITGSAGQPAALAKGLREYGVEARSTIIGTNKFSYVADNAVDCSSTDLVAIGRHMAEIADDYDVFHLHMRPFLYAHPNQFHFPTFWDLLTLKAAGKRVCFHFRGSEVRKASLFRAANKFHYVDEDHERLFAKFKEPSQEAYIEFISAIADRIFVTDPELQSYVPGSIIIPRYFRLEEAINARPLRKEKPVVLHAPSRRGVKGTQFVLNAVDQLKNEGVEFEFKLIEGLTNSETLRAIADSDIIIDQLRIGWYGVLAVEALALGRTVISYIRPDLVSSFGDGIAPIVNANPETIADALRGCVTQYKTRYEAARAGYEWFTRTHSTEAVVPLLISHYEDVIRSPKQIDIRAIQRLIEYQTALMNKSARNSKFRPPAAMSLVERFRYVSNTDGIGAATRATMRFLQRRMFRSS